MENPIPAATSAQYTQTPPPPPPPPCIHQAVRRLIALLVLLFFLASAACSIAWLVLHPHAPEFRVNSLAVSGFNISSPQFAPRCDLELVVTNPNRKIVFAIDRFGLLVSYRGIQLPTRVMKPPPGFAQIPGNRSLGVEFELDSEKLNDKKKRKVLRDMSRDWSKGAVSFEVKVKVRVKFRAGRWLSRQSLVEASCKDLSIEFLPARETGKLHDAGMICSVD